MPSQETQTNKTLDLMDRELIWCTTQFIIQEGTKVKKIDQQAMEKANLDDQCISLYGLYTNGEYHLAAIFNFNTNEVLTTLDMDQLYIVGESGSLGCAPQ